MFNDDFNRVDFMCIHFGFKKLFSRNPDQEISMIFIGLLFASSRFGKNRVSMP